MNMRLIKDQYLEKVLSSKNLRKNKTALDNVSNKRNNKRIVVTWRNIALLVSLPCCNIFFNYARYFE